MDSLLNAHEFAGFALFVVFMQVIGVLLLLIVVWFMRREIADRINRFKNRGIR
jgi:hypothetical protein